MTVDEFIDGFKKIKDRDDEKLAKKQAEYILKIFTRTYVPYVQKISVCKRVADSTSHEEVDGRRYFKVNSPNRYFFFTMDVLNQYTDLEIAMGDGIVEQFDALSEAGLIEKILSLIPENELNTFNTVMSMTMDDLYDNEYSSTSALVSLKEAIHAISDGLLGGFQTAISQMIEEAETEEDEVIDEE